MAADKTKSPERPIVGKVWRFIDYQARWGGGCDSLKKIDVPKYIKWYINGWQGCEGDVLAALNQLRAEPNFIWLQGALVELLGRATNTSRQYQGYLLTPTHEPASASQIGRILRVDGRGSNSQALAVLRKLSIAGFLECVTLEASPSPTRTKNQKSKVVASGHAKSKRKQRKRPKKPGSRSAESPAPLKREKEIGKLAAQAKKIGVRLTDPGAQRAALLAQVKEMQEQPQAVATEAVASSTPPTSSDEAGRARTDIHSGRMLAPSSSCRVGEVIRLSAHRYNGEAWQFADDVLVRAGYLTVADVYGVRKDGGRFPPDQECERAHWAKAWHVAGELFGSDSLDWLREQLFKRADIVRARRAAMPKPQAYLMTAWNNLVKDLKRKGKATG